MIKGSMHAVNKAFRFGANKVWSFVLLVSKAGQALMNTAAKLSCSQERSSFSTKINGCAAIYAIIHHYKHVLQRCPLSLGLSCSLSLSLSFNI